jgi:hypothetical protein
MPSCSLDRLLFWALLAFPMGCAPSPQSPVPTDVGPTYSAPAGRWTKIEGIIYQYGR